MEGFSVFSPNLSMISLRFIFANGKKLVSIDICLKKGLHRMDLILFSKILTPMVGSVSLKRRNSRDL